MWDRGAESPPEGYGRERWTEPSPSQECLERSGLLLEVADPPRLPGVWRGLGAVVGLNSNSNSETRSTITAQSQHNHITIVSPQFWHSTAHRAAVPISAQHRRGKMEMEGAPDAARGWRRWRSRERRGINGCAWGWGERLSGLYTPKYLRSV